MSILTLIRTIQPTWLAGGVLLYALGSGAARFLGARNGGEVFWPGMGYIILLLAGTNLLNEFFNLVSQPPVVSPVEQQARRWTSSIYLALAGACLTAAASLALTIVGEVGQLPQVGLILILILLCGVAYATPPLRLAANGYGELVLTLMVSVLFPALGFIVLYEDMHRLLPMVTFPLAALQLAMMLAFGLPKYFDDLKNGRRALVLRMGWERGMLMHNLLIPIGFLLLTGALFFGLPFVIGGPALLALPLGGLQILMMRQIAAGAKPNWRALTFNAAAMFSVTAYLLAFGFWTH